MVLHSLKDDHSSTWGVDLRFLHIKVRAELVRLVSERADFVNDSTTPREGSRMSATRKLEGR